MNTPKASKLARPIILIILVALLTGVIGFAVGGWSSEETDSPQTVNTIDTNNIVEPQDLTDSQEVDRKLPLDYLTGLPIEDTEADVIPMAFLFESDYTAYGISYASLNVEFPVENGKTRYLSYIRQTDKLGKVGALAKSRSYITSVASAFGGTLFFAGSDDVISEDVENTRLQKMNLSEKNGYSYTEGDKQIYTNPYLFHSAVNDFGLLTSYAETPTLPYTIMDLTDAKNLKSPAKSVSLPFAQDNKTELVYHENEGTYTWLKNGCALSDPLSYGDITYENVFVLFADAATYETVDYTQMVLDTMKSGTGYYLTMGTYERISFSVNGDGNLQFYDTSGKKLSVNAGKSYIGYFKSSMKNSVKIS